MPGGERTRDVYEHIAGYPKPPLVPLPEPEDLSSLERMGITLTTAARAIVRAAMAISGFSSFRKKLSENLETLLRRTNLRGPGLFAPVISATLALADDPGRTDPADRAAALVFGVRDFHADVMAGRLAPDELRGQPLEMGQYPNLFSTSLIVERGRPRVFKSLETSQITVVAEGQVYLLDTTGAGLADLRDALEAIAVRAGKDAAHGSLSAGIFTSASHRFQIAAFRRWESIPRNAESLRALRESFLTVCLDLTGNPANYAEAARLAHSTNLQNRWQHSSLQLVVFGNGKACAICNFSAYLDGNTMMRGAAGISTRAAAQPANPPGIRRPPPARKLEWVLQPEGVEQAWATVRPLLDDQQATFEITGFGRDLFQTNGVAPVPAFVLALQMAANRLTAETPHITQFLSMSRYRAMDLVTADVTTPEVLEFVRSGDDPSLLRAAIESQARECRKARRYLNLFEMFSLFVASGTPLEQRYRLAIGGAASILLRRLGFMKRSKRDILISHPEIYPDIPVVGRPGIRLPYVKYFGLHYQILPDRIVVTLMPGKTWKVPNAELVDELKTALGRVAAAICRRKAAG